MNGHAAFGWMLVREEDYRELMKERADAKSEADKNYSMASEFSGKVGEMAGELTKIGVEFSAYKIVAKSAIERGCAETVRLSGELDKSKADLAALTAKHKQASDDLAEARKLLWGVPDMLPRDAAEQVDWERMGIPNPLEAQR